MNVHPTQLMNNMVSNRATTVAAFLLFVSTGSLFINSLCVFYQHLMFYGTHKGINSTRCCYSVECPPKKPEGAPISSSLSSVISNVNTNPSFTPIKYFLPSGPSRLLPLSSRETLTRIGNELQFDHSLCPPDSVMASDQWSSTPAHSSCPAVFVAGARKAGSTSLQHYLSNHPDFEGAHSDDAATSGETFHFSARYLTEQWDTYMSFFPKQYIMTGDASVGNFVNCKVPKRIFESCGNFSKVVIMLRDPINRYVSNFQMRVRRGTRHFNNMTSLSTTVQIDIKHYIDTLLSHGIDISTAFGKNGPKQWHKLKCLFGPSINMAFEGLYYVHVLNWLCNYPSENILILNSDEFFEDSSKILKEVYQFLGLDPLSDSQRDVITSFIYNKGPESATGSSIMKGPDRKKLSKVYNFFNDNILRLLNWNKKVAWKNY